MANGIGLVWAIWVVTIFNTLNFKSNKNPSFITKELSVTFPKPYHK